MSSKHPLYPPAPAGYGDPANIDLNTPKTGLLTYLLPYYSNKCSLVY